MRRLVLTYDDVLAMARMADGGRAHLREQLRAAGFDLSRALMLRTNRDAGAAVYEQEEDVMGRIEDTLNQALQDA
jgi:hypothetical protein